MRSLLPQPRRAAAAFGAATALLLSIPTTSGAQDLPQPDQGAPPSVLVQQNPTSQVMRAGERANFVISVTNTGSEPLLDVAVRSDVSPACNRDSSSLATLASIAPGSKVTFECTDDSRVDDYTSRAVATGSNALGDTASDWADASVDVLHPSLYLYKDTVGGILSSGDTATYRLTVRNDGEMDLMGLDVIDALVPACNASFTFVAPGEEHTWTCSLPNVTSGFTNVATASAQPIIKKEPRGERIEARDTADVRIPGVSIDKQTVTPIVRSGAPSTFRITVENTGSLALVNTAVDDPLAPDCDRQLGTLVVGESTTYTCTLDATTAGFTNTASVLAWGDEGGPAVSASDSSDVMVINPSIAIAKSVDVPVLRGGGPVTFTITVTNDGDSPLASVTVVDEATPACDRLIGDLAADESVTYTCTVELTESLTNVANVIGVPPAGDAVGATDDAAVIVRHPSIEILKSVADNTVEPGDVVVFTLTVSNNGDDDLVDVIVTDEATPTCDAEVGDLAPGESVTYDCEAAGVISAFTNVATAVGSPSIGPDVTSTDSVDVDAVYPAISIGKLSASNSIAYGADATFTLTVTNEGDTELFGVTVTDAATPACDRTFTSLAIGESQSWTCVATGLTADFLNVASVEATSPDGHTLSGTDEDKVVVAAVAGSTQAPTTPAATVDAANLAITGGDPAMAVVTSGLLVGAGSFFTARGRRARRRSAKS